MINELSIKNIAVIENLTIPFGEGMSVLSGETGAGKSIIIDSINMLLGNKADKSLIRYGEKKALVQAVFSIGRQTMQMLEEAGIDCEDGELIVTRELSCEGKSVCRLNGLAVPLNVLKEISPLLVNIHGQHDNQALLTPSKHISFIDAYADNSELLTCYKELYSKLKEAKERLDSLTMNENERLQRMDLLKYQIEEISAARLKDGEEDELCEERDKILNAENIKTGVSMAYDVLYASENGNAYDGISSAVKAFESLLGINSVIDDSYNRLNDMMYSLEDMVHEIKSFANSVEYSEATIDDIEERLEVYRRLRRKYGGTVGEIQAFCQAAADELENIQNADENIVRTREEINVLNEQARACAEQLTSRRRSAGVSLARKIELSLADLNMDKTKFCVDINTDDKLMADGCDRVEFLISANPGEPPKPLAKISSGGELSRIMLAMKSILAECDGVDTLIFDEIDTGVSGEAAQRIADKLSEISVSKQVICITHLPQLASMADNHYYIEKTYTDDKTVTCVSMIDGENRVLELARITGGEITEISKQHARELLKKAETKKCVR